MGSVVLISIHVWSSFGGGMVRVDFATSLNILCPMLAAGTPIQNRMKDLWALVRWLDVKPFDDHSWWLRMLEAPLRNGSKDALK